MKTILITETEYAKAAAVFQGSGFVCRPAPGPEAQLCAAIQAHDAQQVIVGIQPYRGLLYETLKPGAIVARFGVGHDSIDKAKATMAGILCTNTPGALDDSVAELAVSLLLSAARRTPRLAAGMAAGSWAPVAGQELRGKTLVVAGCGPIGSAVARIATAGFGMNVVGLYRRSRPGSPEFFAELTDDPARALPQADYLSLHIPSTPENAHFLDARRLALLRPSAWVINTARGAVVDEAALYDALASGALAGAALDVFETEPYVPVQPGKDLRTLPNTVLTPHVGSNTADSNAAMARQALRNVERALAGDYGALNLLNPDVLRHPAFAKERGPR